MTGHPDLTSKQAVRAVALQGLVKSYRSPDGAVRAVHGIDVSIEPGETVALRGPNGAGKSTTLDMLLGLTEPDTGSSGPAMWASARAAGASRAGS